MRRDISIDRINKQASYLVEPTEEDLFFQFCTDSGVHYSVGFLVDDALLESESYQLIVANLNSYKSPRDRKVRDTIIAIVDEFFYVNNAALIYLCETADNKQRMRSRLFEYWFSTYAQKARFTTMSSSIIDKEGVVNFVTLIVRNDNPHLIEIVAEFTTSIQLLNQKP